MRIGSYTRDPGPPLIAETWNYELMVRGRCESHRAMMVSSCRPLLPFHGLSTCEENALTKTRDLYRR